MKFIPCLVLIVLFSINSNAQELWNSIDENSIQYKSSKEREIAPTKYSTFSIDQKSLVKKLQNANHEDEINKSKGTRLSLPLPNGKLELFEFYESPCMSPVLAEKFPEIKSFIAISKENRRNHARLDFGTMGIHAVISTSEGTIYIDPYFKSPDQNYISYYVRDHIVDIDEYNNSCGTDAYMESIESELEMGNTNDLTELNPLKTAGDEVEKVTYRLAVTTTGEWGQSIGTKENVMARIVTGINRLNMIFESAIATKFELIDRNDELIFLDPDTDPFVDANLGGSLIGQNSFAINNIVGANAYDIGHVFTVRCTDGVAGIAALGSVCLLNKGNGVSCVGNTNISFFMVNTTAHEIGHQFNGGHTWSNCPSSQGQLSPNTSWEPGSGSTILSYGGICGSQDYVNTNDDYFHVGSLDQFLTFISTTGSCGEEKLSGNHKPDLVKPFGNGVVIPIATPFELEGEATDEDGDLLSYNWEQMNIMPVDGTTNPPTPLGSLGNPIGNSPSFRSFPPSSNPNRLFPRLSAIIGGIGSHLEVLPLYDRNLDFRFNVRDNHPGAGITVWEKVSFKATESAGPFRVTKPNTLTFVEVGDLLDLEWDVANTDNELVDCQFVDIYLSLDNGKNFDILLKEMTPNDGSESIEIPNTLTTEGKIKIKASNNIFFQFNRSNIIIREPSTPGFFIDLAENKFNTCLPDVVEVNIIGTSFQSFDTPVTLDIINPPSGISYEFSNNPMAPNEASVLTISFDSIDTRSNFNLIVQGIAENADTIVQNISISAIGTDVSDLKLLGPVSGSSNIKQTPIFSWAKARNAEYYTLEIATNPSFGSSVVISEEFLSDTSFIPQIVFDNGQLFYWRVIAHNDCITSPSQISTFGTLTLDCKDYSSDNLPKNISFSGNVIVDGVIKVFDVGEVADINIKKIRGQHSDVFQLKGTLISPSGTEVILFDKNCFGATDFNLGFDSDSPIDFRCPLNSGLIIKPNGGDLSSFENETIDGDWIFRLNDTQSGDGGQFTQFDLEICASFEIENPYIINNNILEVPTGLSAKVSSDFLLVGDNLSTSEELIYTLVVLPSEGELSLNGNSLSVGDSFTQDQLNNDELRYIHLGSIDTIDSFTFTVIDGDGGWLDLTKFDLVIDEDVISSISELLPSSSFVIYPNPATDAITIEAIQENTSWNIVIYDLSGKLILQDKMNRRKSLSLRSFENGLYIIKLFSEKSQAAYKLSVLK